MRRISLLAFVCLHIIASVAALPHSADEETLLFRHGNHHLHPSHHHQQQHQNLTLQFFSNISPSYGEYLGSAIVPPSFCFGFGAVVFPAAPQLQSGWIDFKNTTDQWVLTFFSDENCTDGQMGIEGDGIGGYEYGSTMIVALTSAPIITKFTSSWPRGQAWDNIPFLNGIVSGECESWLVAPSAGSISWKYIITEANNTWQYYEYDYNSNCDGEPNVLFTAQIGAGDNTHMVVSKTNDYTCGGVNGHWGSCPPNQICVDSKDSWICQ